MVRFNPSLQVLNKKDQREILAFLSETWGADFEDVTGFGGIPFEELVLLISIKDRLYLGTRGMEHAPLNDLRVNSIGCYIGEYKNRQLRLSIEGSQLIGPHAKKSVVELTGPETEEWMRGETIIKTVGSPGFIILRHGPDFIGCGKATADGTILNFVPKTRRIHASSLPSSP